jgi:steroid delta-isomerase-like uncharacterized protein
MGATQELVTEALRAIDERRVDDALAMMADDIVFRMAGAPADSPAEVARIIAVVQTAFPDLTREVVQCAEDGERAAFEMRFTGRHTGPLMTPMGELPATGATAVWQSADMITVKDGRIASWHVYYDQVGVLAQLASNGSESLAS